MTTYEIIPESELSSPFKYLLEKNNTTVTGCRDLCNYTSGCEAFVWNKNGKCSLRRATDGETAYNANTIVYIKKGKSQMWVVWIAVAIFAILLFIAIFRKKK